MKYKITLLSLLILWFLLYPATVQTYSTNEPQEYTISIGDSKLTGGFTENVGVGTNVGVRIQRNTLLGSIPVGPNESYYLQGLFVLPDYVLWKNFVWIHRIAIYIPTILFILVTIRLTSEIYYEKEVNIKWTSKSRESSKN